MDYSKDDIRFTRFAMKDGTEVRHKRSLAVRSKLIVRLPFCLNTNLKLLI